MSRLHILFILSIACVCSIGQAQSQTHLENEKVNGKDFTGNAFEKDRDEFALTIFLSHDTSINSSKIKSIDDELTNFCKKLLRKKGKIKEQSFLQFVFYKTHKKFLKKYALNSPLYETFEKGEYDCVSGTALYALILEKLQIPYSIKETKFHVYLLTNHNQEIQLFESTDPFEGYINDPVKIKSREEIYSQQQEKMENVYVFNKKIDEEIDILELAGLEFYNRGIYEYNNKNILESLNYFEKAIKHYNSPRIQDIFKMSLETLAKEIKYSQSLGLAKSYEYYSKVLSSDN